MAIVDSLKSKKLPLGVFAGVKTAPSPARIFITLDYSEEFEFLRGMTGFKFSPGNDDERIIKFEIPVMPPTLRNDFGNSKDSQNVARIGEVVLPKFKKAEQFRWESFFPYDMTAPYLNTYIRNLSWDSLKQYKNTVGNMVSGIKDVFKGVESSIPTPNTYIRIFKILSKTEAPFTISMTFYNGGDLSAVKVTLDSFNGEFENNGDYKYEISLVEWTDIAPKKVNSKGEVVSDADVKKPNNKQLPKVLNGIRSAYRFLKQHYPTISKAVVWAFATYNGVRNLVFDGILKLWKIKGTFADLGGRFGVLNNMFGLSKITSKDTQAISKSLKQLSFTKASKQMAELLNQYKMYRS